MGALDARPGRLPRAAGPPSAVNRLVTQMLRGPLAGAVDGALLLLTVRGRRSGAERTLPVQYAPGEDALWVWPGQPQAKTWWRNLRNESPVRLRLRGEEVLGIARVVTAAGEADEFDRGRRAYLTRFPRAARHPDPGQVLVRVAVPDDVLARTRAAVDVPGHGVVRLVRRHPLGAFFTLAYGLSWAVWVPEAIAGGHVSHVPGLLGPMVAAFVVTAMVGGRPGLRDLVGRMVRWRVGWQWYAAALVPLAAGAVVVGAQALVGNGPSWQQLSTVEGFPSAGWPAVAALLLLVNGFGEETGWRGVAWPTLRRRHTLGGAALLLAVPWAGWHLPTFWIDSGMRGFPVWLLPGFLAGLTAGAVVLGWLYERSGASILIVAVWHMSLNMASATTGSEVVAPFVSAVVIAWAVWILRREARSTPARPA